MSNKFISLPFVLLRDLLGFACIGYALLITVLYVMQSSLMYHPGDKATPDLSGIDGMHAISVETSDGLTVRGGYLPPQDNTKPVLLLYHGNAESIESRISKAQDYVGWGWGVLLAEYRGFGDNDGVPSEQGLYRDGHAYVTFLKERGVSEGRIVLYGESLGSAVALEMARHYDARAVVLEGAFASALEIAREKYWYVIGLKYLLKDHYDNLAKIGDVDEPLFMGYGAFDRIIPETSTQKLFDAANTSKRYQFYDRANHVDLHDFGFNDDVKKFVINE